MKSSAAEIGCPRLVKEGAEPILLLLLLWRKLTSRVQWGLDTVEYQ